MLSLSMPISHGSLNMEIILLIILQNLLLILKIIIIIISQLMDSSTSSHEKGRVGSTIWTCYFLGQSRLDSL